VTRRDIGEDTNGAGLRVGVAVATFNEAVTGPLAEGALGRLAELGVAHTTVVRVPGALELPVVARALAADHDAVVAVGAVIEGETDHYVHVATQASAGLMAVSTDTGVPVGSALLTVRAAAHAIERSRPGPGNKGAEAAEAAVVAANAVASLRRG
jgi:6,7-dimethyl-8-ribityllumazine synthase